MLTRRKYECNLDSGATQQITIAASCMDADLRIPASGDRFSAVARAPEELCRFLEAALDADEDAMTIQAGVWAVSNHYSRERIQIRLRKRDSAEPTRRRSPSLTDTKQDDGPAITDEQIDRAKALLDKLDIPHPLESRAEMLRRFAHMCDRQFDLQGALRYLDEAIQLQPDYTTRLLTEPVCGASSMT